MARLFISYKRDEQAYAFALRQWLIDAQDWPPHEVFVDLDKLHAGDAWAEKIFREAEACEAMLFLASELSVRPDSFCYKELQRARGITIAVTLGGLSPDDERLRSALPHGADARQITALDGQPTAAFEYVSPVDGKHGAIALNRAQVESIAQTLRDLGIAPNSFIWKRSPDGPYRGLVALQEGDEALFFGRDREIRDCIRMLEQIRQSVSDRALVIEAPSGAGKSSLLRAGLWRRLRRHAAFSPLAIVRVRQAVLSHEEWGLAAGLARPEANILNLPLETLEDRVSRDLPQLLAELVDADASRTGGRRTMLLGIDQAEEIAALSAPQELDEYRRLFTGLTQAAGSLDIRLVLTARDDSIDATLDRLAGFGITQEAVRTYRLHRMPAPRFKDVIEKPALVATGCGFAVKIDDALSTALAQAAAQNQGEFSDALPILALALQRLVKKRRAPDGSIKAEPDIAARLVSEAVSEAARDAMVEAKADESALRRLMIPLLVTWDPRAGEGGAAKRRVATANELFEGDRGSLIPLADALVNQRLLTRARDNYEVSHEALLRVAPLGSLLLELRSKFLRADMLTMEARDWMEYGRRIEWVARTGERLGDAQALVADPDFGPLLSPSKLGISEYLAACDDKDRQERELRERLDRYELANLTAGAQPQHRLPEPTSNAMPGSETVRGDGLKIYISYARQDVMLSDRISSALMQAGFDVFLDRMDVALGENWLERIQDMITGADKLVILVSPDSVRSEIWRKDLEFAAESGKTLVPVLVRDVPLVELPSDLAKRNIIFMRNEAEFARGMPALAVTLATDLAWVREHTRLQELALLWGRDKNNARLLRGESLTAAERWLASQPASAPLPTAIQREFIGAARRAQLRRSRRLITALASALVFTVTLSAFAYRQRSVAVQLEETALEKSILARLEQERAKQSALRAKSLEEALRQVDANNPVLSPPGSGQGFRDCVNICPEMVVVPAGTFMMGSSEGHSNERPPHSVTILKPFAVSRYAITFEGWDACVSDGGCNGYKAGDQGWGRRKQPVINVSWDDAKAYVSWLSRKAGKTYRLLTEAEREYVTRAGTTTAFWWGDQISTDQANYNGNYTFGSGNKGEYRQKTVPVDSFAPNPWGLFQVHGNVWDWCEDNWHPTYDGAPQDGSAWKGGDESFRVLRGGSWYSAPQFLRSANRGRGAPDFRDIAIGFRVARTL